MGGLLGGSWVLVCRAVSRVTMLIASFRALLTLLPSTLVNLQKGWGGFQGFRAIRGRRPCRQLRPSRGDAA